MSRRRTEVLNDTELVQFHVMDLIAREENLVNMHDLNRVTVNAYVDVDTGFSPEKRTYLKRLALMSADDRMFAQNDLELMNMAEMHADISDDIDEATFAYNEAITGIDFWRTIVSNKETPPTLRRMAITRILTHEAVKRVIETPVVFKGRV